MKFVEALCYHFEAQMQCLQELNLSQNEFTDEQAIRVFDTIASSKNVTLRSLRLSKNRLTDACIPSFVEIYDKYGCKLEEIYLAWNLISEEGGCRIADLLLDAEVIKVLDLSWNSLGSDKDANR